MARSELFYFLWTTIGEPPLSCSQQCTGAASEDNPGHNKEKSALKHKKRLVRTDHRITLN